MTEVCPFSKLSEILQKKFENLLLEIEKNCFYLLGTWVEVLLQGSHI